MGQYWHCVNLDREEFIDPHRLGVGMKLWEQLAGHPGTGAALVVLCASMPEVRGGGDFDLDENWHGPERTDLSREGLMPASYPEIARRTIGRWAGNRIAFVGDYAEDGDLAGTPIPASKIYQACSAVDDPDDGEPWTDITDDVCAVIEHELGGRYTGDGWRTWEPAVHRR